VQALCAAITMAWSVAVTFVLLKFIDRSIGLRADEHEERNGLDLSLHNETGYNY
jgi:Amt family ammonium transporter